MWETNPFDRWQGMSAEGPLENLGPPENQGPPEILGPPENLVPPENLGPPENTSSFGRGRKNSSLASISISLRGSIIERGRKVAAA